MDTYHIWCDLKDGVRDTEFADELSTYLGFLRERGLIESWRLTRRKLGLGHPELGEFHVMVDTRDMAQLDEAFGLAASRAGEVEGLHHAVNSKVRNARFALYRDFPDGGRVRGQERF